MKKSIIVGVATVASLGLFAAPVSAGRLPGTVIVTPDEVEVGGSVVVTNAADADSTCEPALLTSAEPSDTSIVDLEVEDPDGDLIVDTLVIPDTDGNWSFEVTGLDVEGEYTVFASCQETGTQPQSTPAASPNFNYSVEVFQVIAQAPTTTTTSTTSTTEAPGSTTSTTAGAAAVTATPTYAG